ncbi:MAG: EAL domain-containing protein [Clostridiaceae bacterium]|nr:EAL domain-containing protein [Clostridiaceae bacterium]
MKFLRFKSIRKRLLVGITISLMVLIFIFTTSYNFFTQNVVADLVKDNSFKNIKAHAEIMDQWLGERVNEIELYANSPTIKTMEWQRIESYLQQEMIKKSDIYTILFLADTEGNYHTNRTRDAGNLLDREYFHKVMAGETILSNALISQSTGQQIAVIAAPVKNDAGEVVGLMGGSLDLKKLHNLSQSFNVSNTDHGSYSYIIDKEGLVISHPNKSLIMKENITIASEIVDDDIVLAAHEILSNEEGYVTYTYQDVESDVYYKVLSSTDGWRVVCKLPTAYLWAPQVIIDRIMFLTAMVILILGFFGNLFFINKNTQPIIELKEAFDQAAAGDLSVRSRMEYEDEIGDASRSFDIMMDKLSTLTYYDPVTKLPNRNYVIEEITSELAHRRIDEKELSIALFSINKFKAINDIHGFQAGDQVLLEIGERIKQVIEDKNKVSRISGDEFIVIFYEAYTKSDVIKIIEKIIEEVTNAFLINGQQIYITTSAGVVFYPDDGKFVDTLLKNVGVAKLKAKEKGLNQYQLYNEEMDRQLTEELTMEKDIHHALANGEFVLNYQPFIHMKTGEIVEAEALVRWHHPKKGLIPPTKFIPIAEKNNLIISIGNWVLKEACTQNRRWQDQGYKPIVISVNISVIQFEKNNFVETVKEIIEETKLEPKYLQLEITEGLIMKNTKENIQKLHKLKEIGVQISIDDFGTGFSSLSYLTQFPIDSLKIDRSFIREVEQSKQAQTIISTIISMSTALGIQNIAEGIETSGQLEFIKQENCHRAQGYYFSKPIEATDFENLLASNKKF